MVLLVMMKIQFILSDGSCWEIIIRIKQIHTFTSNILFEQWLFGLGCPSLYQVKWQEENENQPIYNYFPVSSGSKEK